MLIELDPRQIADEMMAITALRSLSAPDAAAASRKLLTDCDLPGLMTVMRMTFAEITMELSHFVERCELDIDDPTAPYAGMRMAIEFHNGAELPSGMWIPLKRQLEHAVAAATLAWVTTEADRPLAATLKAQRDGAIRAIIDTLLEHTECALPLWRPAVW